MTRFLLVCLPVLLVACASSSPPTADAAGRQIEKVFEDFNACKTSELVARYSDTDLVFFTGGTERPVTSHAELHEYFSYLTAQPCSDPSAPKHTNIRLQVRPLAAGVALVHANTVVTFVHQGAPQRRPFFFTFVLRESAGQWLVISQNAQAVTQNQSPPG